VGDVDSYDRGRPGYPDRVYELLGQRCGLGARTNVLEIGPGTGQATRRLLDAGASVTAVELGPQLARRLESNLGGPDLRVLVGAFEDLTFEPESFDLVVAATSFHWLPSGDALQVCANALRAGGSLALWWNVFGDPDRPDPFHDALTPILERLAPALLDVPGAGNAATGQWPYALDGAARIGEIVASGRFGTVYREVIPWTGRHRADELRALFASFSPWLALPPDERTRVLDALERLARDEFGGVVERPYLTPVYVASTPG
jgi:SAM-dependent methyltransferase